MSSLRKLNEELKHAMKSKDSLKLESLRAIKSAIILFKTSSNFKDEDLSIDQEVKLLQRLVKQRKESANIYRNQNRLDLAELEESQASIIQSFLPKQISLEEIEKIVIKIIEDIKAESMRDMGKVMGIANKKLSGKADGKTISDIVKNKLKI
ncbi:MAG: GatB/YqeY domain-containing protein [Flavobacteriaceae bacterium]|tara:strand:+ start:374 stop:829 length:456 start_codon:yes stop_codon:yes gene_type:complete